MNRVVRVDHKNKILEAFPCIANNSMDDKIYYVKTSFISNLLNNEIKSKKEFVTYLFNLFPNSYIKFTDLNDEFIDLFNIENIGDKSYIKKIHVNHLDQILNSLHIGGWSLFFSLNDMSNTKIEIDTFNKDNLVKICKEQNIDVAISSYLDDNEWYVFIS